MIHIFFTFFPPSYREFTGPSNAIGKLVKIKIFRTKQHTRFPTLISPPILVQIASNCKFILSPTYSITYIFVIFFSSSYREYTGPSNALGKLVKIKISPTMLLIADQPFNNIISTNSFPNRPKLEIDTRLEVSYDAYFYHIFLSILL